MEIIKWKKMVLLALFSLICCAFNQKKQKAIKYNYAQRYITIFNRQGIIQNRLSDLDNFKK